MDVFDLAAKITLNTSNYTNGLNAASNQTNSFQNKLSNGLKNAAVVGGAAIAGVTTAVGAFAKSAVDAGGTFDKSMSQVAATMGITNEALNNTQVKTESFSGTLRDFAIEMGKNTAFSASQAADALNYMALAGYDAQKSAEMLPTVLNLAAAGNMDLAQASDMVTDASSALGLTTEQTYKMIDQMAAASSSSNLSVSQLGEAMLQVGGTAKNLAGGTNELSTMLGVLADNGIKGAEGGTHLRNIMLAMNPTTDAAVTAWQQLGVTAYDAQGNLRPLPTVFGELNNAMNGMSMEEKTRLLSAMFNKTDLSAVNALLATTGDRFTELSGKIEDSAGAAQRMADVQLDNLPGDITLFKSALEAVQISLSNALTPALRTFVQAATEGLQNLDMNAISASISNVITSLANLMASLDIEGAINIVSAAISFLTNNFDILVPIIAGATAAMIAYRAATTISNIINALTAATQGQTVAQTLLNAVMNANPFVLVATLIAGLVVAVITLWNTNEGFRNAVTNAWETVKSGISAAGEVIKGVFSSIGNAVSNLKSHASAGFNSIVSAFRDIGSHFKNIGSNIVHGIWNGITAGWSWLTDKVRSLTRGLVDGVKNVLGIHSPSRVFAGIGRFMTAGLEEGWVDSYDDVKDTIMSGLDFTDTRATMSNIPVTDLPASMSTGQGDTYIPIYLGNELLDTVLVKAGSRVDYRSGGRVNV